MGSAVAERVALSPEQAVEAGFCGARRPSAEGAPCLLPAGARTDHKGIGRCKYHGGDTPTQKVAARKVQAEQAVRRLGLARGEVRAQVSPQQVLLGALWAAWADLKLYEELVAELDAVVQGEPVVQGQDSEAVVQAREALYAQTVHLTGTATGEARRHVLVQMYEDAQLRASKIASECLRAKVAEQAVQVAQERASAFADAMRALALALGHSPADPQVRQAMRASLLLVAGQTDT